jgi:hypothetical protein
MVNIGVRLWDPAQVSNNLDAVKQKFGRELVICGGFSLPVKEWADYREDEVRQAVRECIDRYAPDGGFMFAGAAGGVGDTAKAAEVNLWVQDESYNYGRDYYLK